MDLRHPQPNPVSLDLDVAEREDHAVLIVNGEVDVQTAPRFREQLLELVDRGHRRIVVDLDGVQFLDSTGLSALVGALKRLRRQNGHLGLVCNQPRILRTLEITGLDKVFTIHRSVRAAAGAPC